MRIILFASPGILGPIILATLIQMRKTVVQLVMPTSQYAISPAEMLDIARRAHVPVIMPDNLIRADVESAMAAHDPDLIVVATFDRKIPDNIIALPRYGAINIHPSLLPRYRGACPEFWTIRNGDRETGITVHHLSNCFDEGNIIMQERVPIGDDDTVGMLLYRLGAAAAHLIAEVFKRYADGAFPKGTPQDEAHVSYAPFVKPHELRIDRTRPVRDSYNLIRAANPVGGAWTTFRQFQMKVWHAALPPEQAPQSRDLSPGRLLADRNERRLFVKASDGLLELKVVQPALYYTIDAWSFYERSFIKKGEVLA